MRGEIHTLVESTWISEEGRPDTKGIVEALRRADSAWRTGDRRRWVRDGDFFGVYLRFLYDELKPPVSGEKRRPLREVVGELRTKQLEDRLVHFAESLPRKYLIQFPLRTSLPFGVKEVRLSTELSLITAETEQETSSVSSLFAAFSPLAGLAEPPARAHQTFLRVQAVGFFDDSPENSAANGALARLRQFTALSFAASALRRALRSDYKSGVNFGSDSATVTDVTDAEPRSDSFRLPRGIARVLEQVVISEAAFRNPLDGPTGGGLIVQALASSPVAEPERAGAIKENLQSVIRVMGAKKADGENLRTAAEWLFDSLAEDNETAALLYASIGLEAALDSPDISTTARLADRLAWMLGRSRKERNSLITAYQDFYRIRSGLVHGRERRLDDDGRNQLMWGRRTLTAVIARDLEQWPPTARAKPQRKAKAGRER